MIHRQTRVVVLLHVFILKVVAMRYIHTMYLVSMRGAYQVQYILIYRILTSWISFL